MTLPLVRIIFCLFCVYHCIYAEKLPLVPMERVELMKNVNDFIDHQLQVMYQKNNHFSSF